MSDSGDAPGDAGEPLAAAPPPETAVPNPDPAPEPDPAPPSPAAPDAEPAAIKTYFVYVNDESGDLYFYEPDTAETTYVRPSDALLLDPETGGPYVFPDKPSKRRRSTFRKHAASDSLAERRAAHRSHAPLMIEVTPEVRQIRSLERRGLAPPRLVIARPISFVPDPSALALPGDLSEEISRFKVAEYASEFFRNQRCTRVFSRKQIRLGPDQIFQTEPIQTPLLLSSARSVAKQALESFKLILSYTGAGGSQQQPKVALQTLRRLLKLGVDFSDLRDEIFFQLVKQTRKNTDLDCALRTWELFLIIATVLPSTRNSENDIKSHLVHHARSRLKNVSIMAQFIYIRYGARCCVGKPMDDAANISPEMVARFLKDPFDGRMCFGVSITEQLWNQRTVAPNCPIPLVLRDFFEALLEKGARNAVGVFRMSGSARTVADLTAQMNETTDRRPILARASVNDLAQLIKQWFSMLPGKLVSSELAGGLRTIFETTKNYVPFVERLPGPEHASLKFVIGLLQELVKYEDVTKMGINNYAIVFGPALVAQTGGTDQKAALKHAETMQDFVAGLIRQWDTADVWPFPESWLASE
jgi:hypothetical protein